MYIMGLVKFTLLVFFCFKINSSIAIDDDPLVLQLKDGKIRGTQDQTVGRNQIYYAYKGIPFAKPPVGELRFLAPVPNDPWDGILDCTEDRNQCVQSTNPVQGGEDCLYINVYTTTLQKNVSDLLPVILAIYGGGFVEGSGSYEYQAPDNLLEERVVFVSFNYRLSILGFLCTGDTVSPGNAGLKDQVLALKWVRDNIMQFGGDPNHVTLFGQSAGAASISYLLQSNIPDGLFKGAIMDSGTSLCRWSLSRNATDLAYKLGASFGHVDVTDSKGLLKNLQSQDYVAIQTTASDLATKMMLEGNTLDGNPMAPVIEPPHNEALFTETSYTLLEKGAFKQVPILMGFNSKEAGVLPSLTTLLRIFLTKFTLNTGMMVPTDMNVSDNKKKIIGRLISWQYFKSFLLPSPNDSTLSSWLTDDLFARPIVETGRLMSQHVPVFFFLFGYEGRLGGHMNRTVPGVVHTEELSYIYRQFKNITPTEEDKKMTATMCRLWTNFAKYGNPTPSPEDVTQSIMWEPAQNNEMNYMYIGRNLRMMQNPEEANMTFWTKYYKDHGVPPYKTY